MHVGFSPLKGVKKTRHDLPSQPIADRSLNGAEALTGDSCERYREKIARITFDSRVQFAGLLDAKGNVLEITQVALDAVGKPFWDAFWWQVSEEINATLRESIRRAAQGEFVRWETEIYGRAGGWETIIIDASLTPITDENGKVLFIAAEGRDTGKKKYEHEIARQREEPAKLDELKTQFLTDISRELRTRLNVLMGSLEEALAKPEGLSAANRGRLDLAHRNSEQLLQLVNALHDFSNIEAGSIQAGHESAGAATLRDADAAERKVAEQALARLTVQSEQQRRLYQTILSSTPDLVYVFDLNHRFTYANEALLTMWGKTADEAIGKNCLELGYEAWHAAMHDREIEQVIATKLPVRGDVPFSGTHGWRIYDYIFVPVLDANGEVEAIAGTTRDVTERKLAEERIRDSEERLRFMAESMPHKIFTARPNGEVDYFNRQWLDYTGLALENVRDWNWARFVHPDDAAESLRLWSRSMESGEPFQCTHRIRREDGAYRWHLSRVHALRGHDGSVAMWIGSSTEIQEQKDTEEDLRRANQDLEQFAYAATHDLQEPLRSVKIYSDLFAKRFGSRLDGQALEFLNYMRDGATRMEMLVRDLLSYTRVANAEAPVELTDAGDCLQIVLANLAGAIAESGARVSSEPLPAVKIPGAHLQQLFQNLISNAIKYRCPDTSPIIHVTARSEKGYWRFTVADNGIGIEAEYKEQIFGLFKRLHTSDRYSGTGVGLALCYRIVDRNRGRIWVESEAGKGSRFHFTIPA